MQGHVLIQPMNLMTGAAQAPAQFRFLARDQGFIESAGGGKGIDPVEGIPAHRGDRSRGALPFQVGDSVVQRAFRVTLAPAAANRGYPSKGGQITPGLLHPTGYDLTIAVKEMHEFQLRRQFPQAGKARVASPGHGKGLAEVQLNHLGPQPGRQFLAAIAGTGIHVDQAFTLTGQRGQAVPQPLALVPTDHHQADGGDGMVDRSRNHFHASAFTVPANHVSAN